VSGTLSKSMKPIQKLADYAGDGNPVIADEWRPDTGWRRQSYRKRASASWLRKLRADGVERIGVFVDHPGSYAPVVADFSVAELLR